MRRPPHCDEAFDVILGNHMLYCTVCMDGSMPHFPIYRQGGKSRMQGRRGQVPLNQQLRDLIVENLVLVSRSFSMISSRCSRMRAVRAVTVSSRFFVLCGKLPQA